MIIKKMRIYWKGLPVSRKKHEISEGTLTDELTYEITYNDGGVFSVLFDRYIYLGGPHGTPLRKSMVIDLNTGMPISLHEIVQVSFKELLKILKERLETQYECEDQEIIDICYENIMQLYHQVDEFKFYIKHSALYIYFDVYEISCYYMGYVDLYIMDLHDYLSERYDIGEHEIVRKQPFFETIQKTESR